MSYYFKWRHTSHQRRWMSRRKILILTCMEELASWFCGSLSSGTFILATETEAAHLPTVPRPEGKEDPAAAGSSPSQSVQPAFCRASRLLKAEGPGMKISPLPFEILVLCKFIETCKCVPQPRPSSFSCRYSKGNGWQARQIKEVI